MKRSFTSTVAGAAAAVALAALAVTGCSKEEKKDPAAASGAGGGEASAPGAAAPALPASGFAVFPATSKVVGGLNLNSARSSALWEMYKPQLEAAMSKELAEFKTACGFDPFMQLQSIVGAGDPNSDEIVLVAKGVKRDQIKPCAEKLAAKEGKKFTATDEGNLTHYTIDGEEVWGAWLDDSTVVFSPEGKKDKAYVAQRAAGEAGLQESAEVMGLLKNVDTSATFYMVATADAMGSNPAAGMMPGAKGFFASIKLVDGLAIDAGVRFDTPDNAKTFTTAVQQQLTAAKGQQLPPEMASLTSVIEKAVIKQNGNDMVVQLKLTNEELKELGSVVQKMGSAFGQMGQMGGATPQ
jgi:hypothetical protein